MTIMVLGKKQTLVVFQIWRIKMDRNSKTAKLNHMLALTEEINVLTQRIKPQATGYLHTTISTLRNRVDELKEELSE